jgi:hypothetical protein
VKLRQAAKFLQQVIGIEQQTHVPTVVIVKERSLKQARPDAQLQNYSEPCRHLRAKGLE